MELARAIPSLGANASRSGHHGHHAVYRPFAVTVSAARRRAFRRGGPLGGDSLAKLDPLASRHSQQVRGTPNYMALKFVRAPITENNFPHHSNDAAAAFIVESAIDLTGEMVEINRASVGGSSVVDQPSGGAIVKFETRFQNGVKLCQPGLRHFTVDGRNTDKQRCGCEPAILVLDLT